MPRATQSVSLEEFVLLVQDGQKADLLEGVIYMASPDSPEAASVNVFLTILLGGFAGRTGTGRVYGPRSAFRLFPDSDELYAPEPDLAFVRRDRLHLWRGSLFQGPPDVAIEIVSPDSVDRDTILKRAAYERAGVREYWIIDLAGRRCVGLRLRDGAYRDVQPEGTRFRSEAVPGFWFDASWLFADELPEPLGCLERVLGSGD